MHAIKSYHIEDTINYTTQVRNHAFKHMIIQLLRVTLRQITSSCSTHRFFLSFQPLFDHLNVTNRQFNLIYYWCFDNPYKGRDLVPDRVFSSKSIMGYIFKVIVLDVDKASTFYTNQNGRSCLSNSQ